jgi:PadR family transcriptional regulator, regulatory protein PadR
MPKGMKVGAVSLWLLLLLSERPMYGYELIRELEKRFSGYWKPKTGTIYPALEKLVKASLVTSRMEFREKDSVDRKHYALTAKGQNELTQTMIYWTKMTEVLENYRETHESIFRFKSEISKHQLGTIFSNLGNSLVKGRPIVVNNLFPQDKEKSQKGMRAKLNPTDPLQIKFLYAKENKKLEIHMEIEWLPNPTKKSKS